MRLRIARSAASTILGHVASAHPEEACGLLLGDGRIDIAQPARNLADDPHSRFEIDPAALFGAHRTARSGGPSLIGYYHSHPNGSGRPSACDAQRAAPDGMIWIIAANGRLGAWQAATSGLHGRFQPVTLHEI